MTIEINHSPSNEMLADLKVHQWPIWTKEISEFPWTYDEREICFILEGDITVIPENGPAVHVGTGDLVTFPKGMNCVWNIHKPVRKHYHFG